MINEFQYDTFWSVDPRSKYSPKTLIVSVKKKKKSYFFVREVKSDAIMTL